MVKVASLAESLVDDRQDWIEPINYILEVFGDEGVREILRSVQDYVLSKGAPPPEERL